MIVRSITASCFALALSACAYGASSSEMRAKPVASPAMTSAEDALALYYDQLRQDVTLPKAPAGLSLADETELTRIAFGSCNHQSRSQHMWAQIAASNPQLFLFIGDNVYGDTGWAGDAAMESTRAAYATQSLHREFANFRAQIPMLATWDDHDYGLNDAGGAFALRRWAEEIFETYWDSSATVRARPGIYESHVFGEQDRQVQLIMLDTRYFRSDFERKAYDDRAANTGPYIASDNPELTMLGAAQWAWLKGELQKPADLRIVVSSVQLLTEAHDWEAWAEMPLERRRLLDLLSARAGGGLVVLSGDRHSGGIYRMGHQGETIDEITSSSLNLAFGNTADATEREPDPKRITPFIAEENFGLVEIDWAAKALKLSLRGNKGEVRAAHTVNWSE